MKTVKDYLILAIEDAMETERYSDDIMSIVISDIIDNGFDGICNGDEYLEPCGCDNNACGCISLDCVPAFQSDTDMLFYPAEAVLNVAAWFAARDAG